MKAGDHEYYSNYFSGFNGKRKPILTQDSPSSGDSYENDAEDEEEEEEEEEDENDNQNYTDMQKINETLQLSSGGPNISLQQNLTSPANILDASVNKPSFIRSVHNNSQASRQISRNILVKGPNTNENDIGRKSVANGQNEAKIGKKVFAVTQREKLGPSCKKTSSLTTLKAKNIDLFHDGDLLIKREDDSYKDNNLKSMEISGSELKKDGPVFLRKGLGGKTMRSARYEKKREKDLFRLSSNPIDLEEHGIIVDESPREFHHGVLVEQRRRSSLSGFDLQKVC